MTKHLYPVGHKHNHFAATVFLTKDQTETYFADYWRRFEERFGCRVEYEPPELETGFWSSRGTVVELV